jgi:hypothetical protein
MTRFAGRYPYTGFLGTDRRPAPESALPWLWFYQAGIFLDFRQAPANTHPYYRTEPIRPWHVSGFAIMLPAILGAIAVKIKRDWRSDPARARTALMMVSIVAWTFLLILFVEGAEGNRLRFPCESYLFVLTFWCAPDVLKNVRALRRRRSGAL